MRYADQTRLSIGFSTRFGIGGGTIREGIDAREHTQQPKHRCADERPGIG